MFKCGLSQAGFLCVVISCVAKLTVTATGSTHRDPVTGWGRDVWVRCIESWDYPLASWQICMQGIPRGSWVGFLIESIEKSVGFLSL